MTAVTTEQPQGTLSADRATEARRLRRRTSDRVIGGVAGGLADYLNVDPLLLRAGFAGLMIFGGAGLFLYVVAWLLIPVQGREDSIVENLLARLRLRFGNLGMAILIFLGVVLAGGWLTGEGPGIRLRDAALLAVAIIVFGIVLLRWGEGPRGPRALDGTTPLATPDSATRAGAQEPALWTRGMTSARPAESRPRERSPLGWHVAAAALVAVGLLALVNNAPGLHVALGQYLGAALAVLGIGLIVGAWWGRARLLIPLGVLLLPVAVTAAFVNVPLDGGIGDHEFRPQTLGELRGEYRLAGGEMRLDLTDLSAGGSPVSVKASVGIGLLVVVVPDDARIELDARVGGGRLSLFGNRQTGTGLGDRVERLSGEGAHLVLNLETGIGEVLVQVATPDGG
jgi:phage shock protein PspC (stress-responsive transcriptional regulator)